MGPISALLMGGAAFLLFVGWQDLIPTNIAWLQNGDRAMHQLGWMFYREAPWGMPPGANPGLGIEIANSIGLVDGLPLFAFPFKLFAAWLPKPFQYWGYWLLLCFQLQGLFAYLIARSWGTSIAIAILASGFALIAPAFAFRYPMHLALGGHWLVLAALWLNVKATPPRPWAWPLLVALTASVHAYLLAMVLALWVASWLQRILTRELSPARGTVEIASVAVASVIVLWAAGFLMTGSLGSKGFGDYKLNLLGFFINDRWSRIFPDIPHTDLDYEGMSFLGIGIMALLLVALATGAVDRLRAMATARWWPLAALVIGMAIFALSNEIAFADTELVTIPLPARLLELIAPFRSSGRFVWPLFYVVTIGGVVLATAKLAPKIAAAAVTLALVLQLVDSAPGLVRFARALPAPAATWTSPLVSPFWERAAGSGYNRLRGIPLQYGFGTDWQAFSYFAVTHGMDLDLIYLGRVDETAQAVLRQKEEQALETGAFEAKTIYILKADTAERAARHLGPDDLLAVIDDRFVFARGGAKLIAGLGIAPLRSAGH